MRFLTLVLCVLKLVLSVAHADILYVPGNYPTIQEALANASTGDTVLVAPGTYYEHIIWPGTQSITLQSECGPDSTIIDASGTGRVITIETQVDSTTLIEGFAIANGNAGLGGGVLCNGASPTIRNNVIISNYADYSGGGIYCVFCSPLVIGNEISNNEDAGSGGGGIACYESGTKIIGNIISANVGGFEGGGIQVFYYSQSLITGNTITGNSAHNGGGVHIEKSCVTITYNNIFNNSSENQYRGDGINFCGAEGEVNYNNICGNGHGMYAYFQDWTVNAEYNWWGDASGPYHPDSNPGGLGDSVSDYVDFNPWFTEPVAVEEQPIIRPVEKRDNLSATMFSGPLQLPKGKKCKVFDITGRVVEPGKIQLGIYFIEVDGVVTQKVVKVK